MSMLNDNEANSIIEMAEEGASNETRSHAVNELRRFYIRTGRIIKNNSEAINITEADEEVESNENRSHVADNQPVSNHTCAGFVAFVIFAVAGIIVLSIMLLKIINKVTRIFYFSSWMPSWMWLKVAGAIVLALASIIVGVMGAKKTLFENIRGAAIAFVFALAILVLELQANVITVSKSDQFFKRLDGSLQISMTASMNSYIYNSTDKGLWDEIQIKESCCGVMNYTDWSMSGYGNSSDVPDSCCLLMEDGCGLSVDETDPEDDILTEGCLPVLLARIMQDFENVIYTWKPVIYIHGISLSILIIIVDQSWLHIINGDFVNEYPIL